LWHRIERAITKSPIKTWTTLIVHDIDYINRRLERAHYFFSDIKKEGVLLYDSKKFKLARRRKLDPEERAEIAKDDFKQWFHSAEVFYIQYENAFKIREYKNAAFQLHQATERYYAAVMLVFTGYKPKTHDLEKLSHQAAGQEPAFLPVFPRATEKQKHRFELLRRAYVDARYDKNYKITRTELKYLAERVLELKKLTARHCKKKIKAFV
ncbi:unnamed protein product, partial [marine sediment metagenome]